MMNTPICDFAEKYRQSNALRMHMPGHKGKKLIGVEALDITEISGADSLYEAKGIIAESERNASLLFGCHTFYSAEGSSLCIRAMVYLAKAYGCKKIFAARNAHKAFISAVALTDTEVQWLPSCEKGSYLSCRVDTKGLESALKAEKGRTAVYITSPDYLGNITDISAVSAICKKYGALLMVDNAHGAYLKFLPESVHPIDLGADICCDSAHKTLPVITGGAYLHISKSTDGFFVRNAKNALSLFGTTSPSYLILQSLDRANRYIADAYSDKLSAFAAIVAEAKQLLSAHGYSLTGDEALKIVIQTKKYGYYGTVFARELESRNIYCEFADRDHAVFMLTPENGKSGVDTLISALVDMERRAPIIEAPPVIPPAERVIPPREAVFAQRETVTARDSIGRVLADFNIACPPAVPLVVCGERISESIAECFEYYGISDIGVIKE